MLESEASSHEWRMPLRGGRYLHRIGDKLHLSVQVVPHSRSGGREPNFVSDPLESTPRLSEVAIGDVTLTFPCEWSVRAGKAVG